MIGETTSAPEAGRAADVVTRPARNRDNPSLFDALAGDPTIPIERHVKLDIVKDLRRWSRRYLFPTIRVLVLLAVHAVIFLKRLVPFRLSGLKVLSWGTVWFGKRLVSPEAQRLFLRHFIIETNILNFIARNSGGDVPEYDLLPTRAEHLGEWNGTNSVALHDANVMNLMIDLGDTAGVDVRTKRPLEKLDFSMITVPELHVTEDTILFGLDFPSAVYISVFFIVLFFDDPTIERAINSFQLDESLLTCLADMTGDETFRTWTPVKFPTWLGSPTGDAARDLHFHILVHEYVHHRLLGLRAEAERRRLAA
jgi:hypothetical protein